MVKYGELVKSMLKQWKNVIPVKHHHLEVRSVKLSKIFFFFLLNFWFYSVANKTHSACWADPSSGKSPMWSARYLGGRQSSATARAMNWPNKSGLSGVSKVRSFSCSNNWSKPKKIFNLWKKLHKCPIARTYFKDH